MEDKKRGGVGLSLRDSIGSGEGLGLSLWEYRGGGLAPETTDVAMWDLDPLGESMARALALDLLGRIRGVLGREGDPDGLFSATEAEAGAVRELVRGTVRDSISKAPPTPY